MKINVDNVVFREDLYPRFEPNQSIIQKYANSIEFLPPIKINQNNILIDGFHRWKAHQLAEEKEINVDIVDTNSELELKKLAYQHNSNHGLQLSNDEKRKYAQEMIGEQATVKELSKILSVDERTILRWTQSQREALEKERNRQIIELYLRAENTQQSIADKLGIGIATANETIKKFEKRHLSEIENNFKPILYNIWNLHKQDNVVDSHFGSFPQIFMENLLYYHTEPLDIVYDPFAGGGTTVDVCKKMFRRYYCSDLIVKPGREKDIKQWDINEGLPEDLPKPDFVFLDPPYWLLAKKEYSNNENDLGNMSYAEFLQAMYKLFDNLIKKMVPQIAIVIRPMYSNNLTNGMILY